MSGFFSLITDCPVPLSGFGESGSSTTLRGSQEKSQAPQGLRNETTINFIVTCSKTVPEATKVLSGSYSSKRDEVEETKEKGKKTEK